MARVVLQPLTRVEGHGRVELVLHEGRLQKARVALIEAPRLFEKIVLGRAAAEVPELVCRICAICSAVHKLTALAALEKAMAIEVPPAARLVRELLLLGGHIQSHALHLFCLILPDFSGETGILDMLRRGDRLAAAGLELKAFGNRLQEAAGGRVIHPINAVLGGVVRRPAGVELSELQKACALWLEQWPRLAATFAEAANYPAAGKLAGTALATGAMDRFALFGDRLFLAENESAAVNDYAELLAEQPVAYSRARQAAGGRGPFLVGALARQQLWTARDGQQSEVHGGGGVHANNAAQVAEVGWALDRVAGILEELARLSETEPLAVAPGRPQAGVGTAACEAPRGLLIHHYVVDDWGQVVGADVVTPTAINQLAMERQLLEDLGDIDDETVLRNSAERIIRAFDPCISCAVHVIRC